VVIAERRSFERIQASSPLFYLSAEGSVLRTSGGRIPDCARLAASQSLKCRAAYQRVEASFNDDVREAALGGLLNERTRTGVDERTPWRNRTN
jgi:hypothetical protein